MLDSVSLKDSRPDPLYRSSTLARPALLRVVVTAVGLVPLWLAIAWAVAVP